MVPNTCTSTLRPPDIEGVQESQKSTESRLPNQKPFHPAWWLPGAHLPTIFSKFGRRVAPAQDRIERWETPDGDAVSVARVDPPSPDAPLLTIFHGLEGSIGSTYAQGLMHQARARGWGAAMLIWRSCDGRVPNAPRLYHTGETSDAGFFLRRLAAERPGRPIFSTGVSLGGNVLLKWLGEQGRGVPPEIQRAVAVSTPFDLAESARKLSAGFSRIYSWHFVRKLKQKAFLALGRHPQLDVDRTRLKAARTFWEFDEVFTGPVHGFAGADDYYARASSINFLTRIQVPTLLYSAVNDPFLPPAVLDRVREIAAPNPLLTLDFTTYGGHVGWIGGHPWSPEYQLETRVTNWLNDSP